MIIELGSTTHRMINIDNIAGLNMLAEEKKEDNACELISSRVHALRLLCFVFQRVVVLIPV